MKNFQNWALAALSTATLIPCVSFACVCARKGEVGAAVSLFVLSAAIGAFAYFDVRRLFTK